jgi:formate dehydrogenase subunit delta
MENRDMIRMANQIASYFKAYPESEAVTETAQHFRNFWELHMRQQLIDHVSRGGEGLDPLVIKAVKTLPKPSLPGAGNRAA